MLPLLSPFYPFFISKHVRKGLRKLMVRSCTNSWRIAGDRDLSRTCGFGAVSWQAANTPSFTSRSTWDVVQRRVGGARDVCTWRLLCSSFMGSILITHNIKLVTTRNEVQRSLQVRATEAHVRRCGSSRRAPDHPKRDGLGRLQRLLLLVDSRRTIESVVGAMYHIRTIITTCLLDHKLL